MDGNGRWAAAPRPAALRRPPPRRRGLAPGRARGDDLGVRYLTVYSFSCENWARPPQEVAELMGLLKLFIRNDLMTLEQEWRAGPGHRRARQSQARYRRLLDEAEQRTRHNTKLDLIVAFNYGSRQEIVEAARAWRATSPSGLLRPRYRRGALRQRASHTAGTPDPDLIIRTSGEMRLSNFLMWQSAYSELVFLPICWPDFDRPAFAAGDRNFAPANGASAASSGLRDQSEVRVMTAPARA